MTCVKNAFRNGCCLILACLALGKYNRKNNFRPIRMSMIVGFILLLSFQVKLIQGVTVSLVTKGPLGSATKYGLSQMQIALQDKKDQL
jgi:hypothetical protein